MTWVYVSLRDEQDEGSVLLGVDTTIAEAFARCLADAGPSRRPFIWSRNAQGVHEAVPPGLYSYRVEVRELGG